MIAVIIKIVWVKPLFKRLLEIGPFPIDGGIPGRVTVALLVDRGLTEDAFIRQAQSLSRYAGWRIERIAFPLIAPVAECKCLFHHQVHRFGRGRCSLQ
ncbi:uncharacterized protein METZ01_LOCUS95437 [marine metagenome]|uniref:Uncharacterized protein n=1 Tax=marine metagenome TaxID=408172 RepID=A0A381VSP3_9ZZZZ